MGGYFKIGVYGLLKTSPQSGTYVAGFNVKILDTIFADIITFNKDDFASLIETRYFLEINTAKLAAERITEVDIKDLTEALKEFDFKFTKGIATVDEDLVFHIKIAVAGKNSVLESMILILDPILLRLLIWSIVGLVIEESLLWISIIIF